MAQKWADMTDEQRARANARQRARARQNRPLNAIKMPWGPLETVLHRRLFHHTTDSQATEYLHLANASLIATHTGIDRPLISRYRARGWVALDKAEQICNWIGVHPIEVWPDEYLDGLERLMEEAHEEVTA